MFWFTKLSPERRRTIGHWLMELVIVVAGVLIALWLQQWGEHRRAVANMKAAETAIHEEIGTNLTRLLWRQAIQQCHLDRVQLLKSMLMKADNRWPGITESALQANDLAKVSGIKSAMPGIYQRPGGAFVTSAWNSALATGALAPMEQKRFQDLAFIYDQFNLLIENSERENRAATILSSLVVPQELTPDIRNRMFEALYQVDTSRFMYNLAAAELPKAMMDMGWNDRDEVDGWIKIDEAGDRERKIEWRSCVAKRRNPFAEAAAKD